MTAELTLFHDTDLLCKEFNLAVGIRKLCICSIKLGVHRIKLIL